MGKGRTGRRYFASAAEAEARIDSIAQVVRGSYHLTKREAKFNNDTSTQTGAPVPGKAVVRYWVTFDGYHFVDRFCGLDITLDPQDGALLSYSENFEAPPTEPLPRSHMTSAQAHTRAFPGRSMPKQMTERPELGWALPKGATRARLAWAIRQGKLQKIVDAVTGAELSLSVYK